MKSMTWIWSFSMLLLLAVRSEAVMLVENGQPQANIVIEKNARSLHRFAASELQKYIQQISGAELPIVADGTEGTAPNHIYVGDSDFTRKLGINTTQLPEEGLVIQAGEKYLALVGRDTPAESMRQMAQREYQNLDKPADRHYSVGMGFGRHGEAMTLDAAYHFLEDFCGIRWYMPGPLGVVVPEQKTLKVKPTKVIQSPRYHYRNWDGFFYSDDPAAAIWSRQIGYGTSGNITANHSLYIYAEKVKEHPEWCSLYDGKRSTEHVCLASEELMQQVIQDARTFFDAHPEQANYIVMPNDGYSRMCDEPRCQTQVDKSMGPSGDFSNYVWGFVNKMAQAIAQSHPGKLISCVAYDHYTLPPKGIKLSPNIYVRISKRVNSYHDPTLEEQDHRIIQAWRKASKDIKVGIYEYYDDHAYAPNMRAVPQSIPHTIGKDYLWLASHGMDGGAYIEGGSELFPPTARYFDVAMTHLNFYVTGKMLWDPRQDVDSLLSEYYSKFYGPAAGPMRRFYELIENIWMKRRKFPEGNEQPWRNLYPPKVVGELFGCLDEAKRLAGDSIYGKRVSFLQDRDQFGEMPLMSKAFAENWPIKKETIFKTATPPVLEGDPSDACWQQARPLKMIRAFDGLPAFFPGYAEMCYDQTNLYVLGVFDDSEMDIQYVASKKRDDPIWEDSSIEVFLDTNHDHTNYYQVLVNMNGVVGSNRKSPAKSYPFLDTEWIPHVRQAVRKEAQRWMIELAIPLADLGVNGSPTGQTWGVNIYRNRKTTKAWSFAAHVRYASGWNATFARSWHVPNRFGEITFVDAVHEKGKEKP